MKNRDYIELVYNFIGNGELNGMIKKIFYLKKFLLINFYLF
jgi:hypothetical protein